jgi:DNA-binding NtrC family response regulator
VAEVAGAGLALHEAVSRSERAHIALVLRLCEGNRERAAEELDISPATLYRRIEKLGLKGWEVRGARS